MFKGEPGIQGASEARNITRRWEAEGDRFALNLGRKLPRTEGAPSSHSESAVERYWGQGLWEEARVR